MYRKKLLYIIVTLLSVIGVQGASLPISILELEKLALNDPPCDPVPGPNAGDTGCIEFIYSGQKVRYTTVRGTDGYIWLQQNLGSIEVASSETDVNGFGDYFQWGRWDDGHQLSKSTVQTTIVSPNDPTGLGSGNSSFISSTPGWWNSGTIADSWTANSAKEITENEGCDPCKALGVAWSMPTESDWKELITTAKITNIQSAYNSELKLTVAGNRGGNGNFNFVGLRGYYWSKTLSTNLNYAKYLYYSNAAMNASSGAQRSQGAAVRCILKINEAITKVGVNVLNNDPAQIKIYQGKLILESNVYPLNHSQDVVWAVVSGGSLATINGKGVVTAIDAGTIVVRVSSVENPLKYAEISIEISNQLPPCNKEPGLKTGDIGCVTFIYDGQTVQYTTIRAADGNVWLQQNLGSNTVAKFEKDEEGYGDLFQWGRWDDGHQLRSSVSAPAMTASEPSLLGKGSSEFLSDWWDVGDKMDQWTASDVSFVDNTNGCDPCKALGAGWSIPTENQWKDIVAAEHITNIQTAFDSNLKMTIGGTRNGSTISFNGVRGFYWSKTAATSLNFGKSLYYSNFIVNPSAGYPREQGQSVRCIFDVQQVVKTVQVLVKNNMAPVITVPKGNLELEALVLPLTANQSVKWTIVSGNASATVNYGGKLTAISDGKIIVRATSVEDVKVFGELEITIAQVLPCAQPNEIVVDAITSDSAMVSWNATGALSEYELRTSGIAGSGSVGLVSSGVTSAATLTLQKLVANTQYVIYFRTKCGEGDLSDWANETLFRTGCLSMPEPITVDQAFCESATVADLLVSGLVNADFKWYKETDTSTVLDLNAPLTTGNYTVMQSVDNCESPLKTIEVIINDVPIQPLVKTPQILVVGNTLLDIVITNGINSIWYASLIDAQTDKNRLDITTPLVSGISYYVLNQSEAGCFSEVATVEVSLTLKTKDFNKELFHYHPNPTDDFVMVDYNETILSYVIFDLQGRQLNKQVVNSIRFKIHFKTLPAGVYFVELQTEREREIIRIIKK